MDYWIYLIPEKLPFFHFHIYLIFLLFHQTAGLFGPISHDHPLDMSPEFYENIFFRLLEESLSDTQKLIFSLLEIKIEKREKTPVIYSTPIQVLSQNVAMAKMLQIYLYPLIKVLSIIYVSKLLEAPGVFKTIF